MAVVKFALVGFLNTAVGFVIIMTALAVGFNDYTANALGYALGLGVSYCLNRSWTFAAKGPSSLNELILFGCVFAIAYSANLLVLAAFRAAGSIDQPFAHFSGLAVYSALFYVFSRKVVFGEGGSGGNIDLRSVMQHYRAKLPKTMPFIMAVLATFVVLLLFVGKPIPIVIWDEGRIIANAMEMRQNGLSLITTYNSQPDLWNTKPPLLVWLMTGSMALFGPSELALRIPSLISSLGTILMVMLFLRHITRSVPIAVFGGLSLTASVGFFGEHGARTGDYDALLCFFTTGYILLLFFAIHRQRPPLRWLFLAGALAAGALMTKSVAGAVPAAGLLIYVLLTGRWRRLFITPRYIAAAAFAIFPIIGFLALREYADPGYLNAMTYNDVTGRFNEALDDHSGPPWYYLEATFVHGLFSLGMAALIAPLALPLAHGKTRLALTFALCITIGHLVIVTMSSTKLQHYYLSSLPFIAIAAALAVHAALNHVQALAAAGGLSPLRLTIIRRAPALLLLVAMAQAAQIRINVLDPRVDYPSARYGALLDALADQRAPILLVDRGWKVPNDPHYAPELRYYAMVARENGRNVEQTGDVSQIASAAAGTIVASCEPPVTAFLLDQMRKRLLETNGCVAGWKDA